MPYDCFISYSSTDLKIGEELNRRLINEGFTVWFDKARLDSGCDWHREIEQGCENSRVFLPILTPRWKLSEWTRYETYGAEAVIPLVCEGAWEEVATPPLERFQAEKIEAMDFNDSKWSRFCASIRRVLAGPVPSKLDRLVHLHYRVNDHFVGRDNDIVRIHEELHRNPRAVLTQGRVRAIAAMGGVGKTTLARHYAEKFWRCYPQILWVDVRSGLETEFAEMHDLLFPDRRNIGLEAIDKAKQALNELQGSNPRLLIIDNATDEESTAVWIPKTGACHTLITSRFAGWSEAVKTLHLFVLEKEPAVEFLERRVDRRLTGVERAACETLAEKLGYLPLALEQAAAYIKKLKLGFGDYLKIYEKAQRDLLAVKALGSTEYPDSVITSLQPSANRLEPGARAILNLAAMVATTPLPLRTFAAKPELIFDYVRRLVEPDPFAEPADFEFWLLNQVGSLVDYSLVSFEGQAISLHPLQLTVLYEAQPADQRRRSWSAAAQLLIAASPMPTWKVDCREQWTLENEKAWERLQPHIDRLISLQNKITGLEFLPAFELTAINALAMQNRYPDAIAISKSLCDRIAAGSNDSEEILIEAKDCLACLLKQHGNYKEALETFRSVHELRVATGGEDHPAALRALHNVACLMELLDDTAGAESIMRHVLEERRRIFGEDHYDTIISVHDLGWLLNRHDERLDEAEPLLSKAVEHWKRTLGIINPDTRDAISNLASLFRHKDRFEEAAQIQRDLLEGTQMVLGKDHLTCFEIMHNLSLFEFNCGHNDIAHQQIAAVVEGYRRYLPPNHRDMLTALQDLGTILTTLHRFEEAEPLLREALEGYEKTQGPDTTDTLRTVLNLANLLFQNGRPEEAKPLQLRHLRALQAQKTSAPADLRQAAHTCLTLGEYGMAESFLQRVLAAGYEIAGTRSHLARICMITDRPGEARDHVTQGWAARTNAQPYMIARLLWLQYALDVLDGNDSVQQSPSSQSTLSRLKTLLKQDKPFMEWTMDPVLDHIKDKMHQSEVGKQNWELLHALVMALSDEKNLANLDQFPTWRDTPSEPQE